ncbi:MAG: hypothetical protein ABIQ58_05725 [Candidatus Limnocylindrales bacterium]
MTFAVAQQVADTVLYEGYALYPYRASSSKNQVRWQFGVVAPRAFAEADGSERWWIGTEILLEPVDAAPERTTLDIRVRCLQLQARLVERATDDGGFVPTDELLVEGMPMVSWDEAVERTIEVAGVNLAALVRRDVVLPVDLPASEAVELARDEDGTVIGRVVRRTWAVTGTVTVRASGSVATTRIGVRIENTTPWSGPELAAADRTDAVRRSMVGVHTLLGARGGSFVSLTDPPAHLAPMAAACENVGAWPVLCGRSDDADVVLASPIILPDHPAVAPESPGDLFDATEIDEILTLRIMTLTDDEKREARATDERARRIIDRSDNIPPEIFERLHGAIRSLRGPGGTPLEAEPNATEPFLTDPFRAGLPPLATGPSSSPFTAPTDNLEDLGPSPFWEPEARVAPELASIRIGDREVRRGTRVRLRPGPRGDTMDAFIDGSTARVEAVFESVDDELFVAVTLEVDPAGEMHSWQGRYFYFRPEELDPLADEDVA